MQLTNATPIWIAKEIIEGCEKNPEMEDIDIIGLWKYLSMMKYIKSGKLEKKKKEFLHEFNNLVNLLIKNVGSSNQIL